MDTIPLWGKILGLAGLILLSAFFSMTETALMAANRHRLRHLAKRGNRLAHTTLWLLERVDKLLSVILITNTLLNALVTALVTALAIETFGNDDHVITLATSAVAFLLIVFAEISPKIIGARYPERISLPSSLILRPLILIGQPLIWFVNLFVNGLLRLLRIQTGNAHEEQRISPEELRSIVLEGGNFIPQKHKSILLNLFDLEHISVNDIMTPRPQLEALDLSVPVADIVHQLSTCYHNKLPVYEGEINRIVGILHVRKALALIERDTPVQTEDFRALLTPPYFIPRETDVFAQLQFFQEKREKLALIVDEYGELQGLVTLEDIIEEMIGEFTTSTPGSEHGAALRWAEDGTCLVEGSTALREINRRLHVHFPLDGPRTLNGYLLEVLQEIPDHPVSVRTSDCVLEIVQLHDQSIKRIRLRRLAPRP